MNKLALSIICIGTCFASCTNPQPSNTETVSDAITEVSTPDTAFNGLRDTVILIGGTCNNCKMNIEKAANAVPGVAHATWTIATKKLRIGWKDSVSVDSVIAAVESAGYMRIDAGSTEE